MRKAGSIGTLGALAFAAAVCSAPSFAQDKSSPGKRVDLGKSEFEQKCASCHGADGTGNGPAAPYMTKKPADLTVLARGNRGVVPVAQLYDTITGQKDLPVHGTREMPVWGSAYRIEAGEHFFGVPYDPEAYVRARVLSLIEYVSRLQKE